MSIFPTASTSLIAASTYNKSNMQQAASHNIYIFSVTCPVCSLTGTITRPAYFCHKRERIKLKTYSNPKGKTLQLTESWSLVFSKLSCMGETVGLWGGAGTLWMETPGPTLRTSCNFQPVACETQVVECQV